MNRDHECLNGNEGPQSGRRDVQGIEVVKKSVIKSSLNKFSYTHLFLKLARAHFPRC